MRIEELIIEYHKRYKKAQIQDYIKLFFQNSFGVKHASKPSDETLKHYLEQELVNVKPSKETPHILDIGNGYVRVSLMSIKEGTIDQDTLMSMFKDSMGVAVNESDALTHFKAQIDTLIILIEQGKLPFDLEDTLDFLDQYLEQGLNPVHHSKIYKEAYHPHYRVIHKSKLKM